MVFDCKFARNKNYAAFWDDAGMCYVVRPVVMFYFFGFCYYFNNISTIISNIYNQIHRSFVRNFCDMEIHSRTCQHQREQKKTNEVNIWNILKWNFVSYISTFFSRSRLYRTHAHTSHIHMYWILFEYYRILGAWMSAESFYIYISMRTREYKIMAKLVHITKLTAIINQKRSKNYDRKCCWKQRKSSAHIHGMLERNAKVDEFQF